MLDAAFSVGMLFAFMAYKEQFSARVAGLIDKLIELKMLQLQGERLADIVLTPPEEEAPAPAPAVDEASIEVRNLSFRYSDTEPFVLQGLLVPHRARANRWRSSARRAAARRRS